MLDPVVADRILNAFKHPRQAANGGNSAARVMPAAPGSASMSAAAAPLGSGLSLSTLSAAQLRRELIRFERETLELAREKNLVLRRDEVHAARPEMIGAARNALLSIPDELGDILASEYNPILGRAGRRVVVHLPESWGGLRTRNPLLVSILKWETATSPKLDTVGVT